jgi:NAD(P)-dependent dehydrogenase (short-subunit alcohol dehydrogenase family)
MGVMDSKVALVTGAAAGIGKATALAFAAEGASVAVVDSEEQRGGLVADEIREAGGRALFIPADVSQTDLANAMVGATMSRFGRLDFAFNNAGIEGDPGLLELCSDQNWDRTLAVNLTGVFVCMRAEIPAIRDSGGQGAIVNCASIAGLNGFPGLAAYVASKHGVNGLTRSAALELAADGIRVNSVCPGAIETEMIQRIKVEQPELIERTVAAHPLGRLGQPEEIAACVIWLCSAGAGFVTGQAIAVDGGFTTQ